MCLLKARERLLVLVRLHKLPYYETYQVILFIVIIQIVELVPASVRHVCCDGLDAGPKELQRILEH